MPSRSAVAAIVLFAIAAGGSFVVVQRLKPFAVAARHAPEAVAPRAGPPAGVPEPTPSPRAADTPAPSPRTPDRPIGPRQMLKDIFEGRDRARTVTASVDGSAVRISSSRPGYVYVLAASDGQSDDAALFAAVLFPRATDTNNRVRAGQTLTLPDLAWPTNAEFLAIVSDAPRDIDVLGSLAGKVVCATPARCSESYGAAVLASEKVRALARNPAVPKAPTSPTTPVTRPVPSSRRCSDILERASLGEQLTDEEQTYLTRDCR
ncbi:MAG TPA: hypothetical protein VIF11_04440 [Methylomirabilota bacterium]|jgi:hypothetical protein